MEQILPQDIDVLARTLYGEARGEGLRGLEAVASVVMNRVKVAKEKGEKYWWGKDVVSVCKRAYQFSCWNGSDVNKEKLMKVCSKDKMFALCVRVARKAIAGILKDETGGATHYHTNEVEPNWAVKQTPSAEIGSHIFYKLS